MKYSPFLLTLGLVLSAWWGLRLTVAQPEPILPTPEAACAPYFAQQATPLRSCASIACAIVQTLEVGQNVCVIGTADDPNWLWVDLNPYDNDTPPLYLPKEALNPNAADSVPQFSSCQPMLVNGDQTNLYSCADTNCRVVGILKTDEWVCAREYTSGQYTGWAFAEMSDGDTSGWLALSSLRRAQNYSQNAPAYQAPVANANPAPQVARAEVEPPDLENSSAPIDLPLPLPPCQQYQVVTYQTKVRECASVNCAVKTSLPYGSQVCVRGITPNRGWLIVDLDPEAPLYAVYENALAPSIDFQEVAANTCNDPYQVNSRITTMVRSCPSLTCPSIDRLSYGTEVCALTYGGSFQEWIQVSGANVVQNGWIHSSLLKSLNQNAPNNPNLPPTPVETEVAQLQATPLATPLPTSVPLTQQSQDVTFSQLNIPDIELNPSRLSYRIDFNIPTNWQLNQGLYLNLNMNYFNVLPANVENSEPSVLAVRLDEVLIASIELDDSVTTSDDVVIRIPESLFSRQTNPRHSLILELMDEASCRAGGSSFVLLQSANSFFHWEYNQTTPLLDLSQYPQPLFLPNINPQVIFLVLPENPSPKDIEIGALIAMGLGSSTRNQVRVNVRTPRSLTEEEQNNHTLILMGSPETHTLIRQYYEDDLLLTQFNAEGQITYNDTPLTPEQGVWQLLSNPANPLYPVALITGNSPEGIYRAAFALTNPTPAFSGSLAIVENLAPPIPPKRFAEEVTFQELGVGNILLTSALDEYVDFAIPYTTQITKQAQLALNFQISPALQTENSDFSIWLNDEFPIISANVQSLETDEFGGYNLEIPLPADLLRRGQVNSLRFSITGATQGEDPCNRGGSQDNTLWINLNQQSRLYFPNESVVFTSQNLHLGDFPQPFSNQRDLANLLISLPSPISLSELEQVYQLLGIIAANTDDGGNFLPQLAFGAFPPQTDLSQYHILLVGRPSTNALLKELNPILRQPFEEGADTPTPLYNPPATRDLGILQVFPSLWSPNHAILVISGTSEVGQSDALNILLSPETDPALLNGDLSFVNGLSLTTLRSYEN